MSAVDILDIDYLWEDYAPRGHLIISAGPPKVGKSIAWTTIAAKVSCGLMPGDLYGKPQNIIYSATEDSLSTVKARYLAAGGDPSRFYFLNASDGDPDDPDGRPFVIDEHADDLLNMIREVTPGLVVLDALNSSITGKYNDSDNVRPQLEALSRVAKRTNTTIVGVAHFKKSVSGIEPLDAIGGAGAYREVVRHALGFMWDEQAGCGVMSILGSNEGERDIPSLTYALDSEIVMSVTGKPRKVVRLTFGEPSETSVRDIMQRAPQGEDEREERDEVKDFLYSLFTDPINGGAVPARDVAKAARNAGLSQSDRQIRRVAKQVGVTTHKVGSEWVWRYDPEGDTTKGTPKQSGSQSRGHQPLGGEIHVPLSPSRSEGVLVVDENRQGDIQGDKGTRPACRGPLATSVSPCPETAPARATERVCPECHEPVEPGRVRHSECYRRASELDGRHVS